MTKEAEAVRQVLALLGVETEGAARIAAELAATAERARNSATQPGIDDDPTHFARAQR